MKYGSKRSLANSPLAELNFFSAANYNNIIFGSLFINFLYNMAFRFISVNKTITFIHFYITITLSFTKCNREKTNLLHLVKILYSLIINVKQVIVCFCCVRACVCARVKLSF